MLFVCRSCAVMVKAATSATVYHTLQCLDANGPLILVVPQSSNVWTRHFAICRTLRVAQITEADYVVHLLCQLCVMMRIKHAYLPSQTARPWVVGEYASRTRCQLSNLALMYPRKHQRACLSLGALKNTTTNLSPLCASSRAGLWSYLDMNKVRLDCGILRWPAYLRVGCPASVSAM
jgi:hypothetical protein